MKVVYKDKSNVAGTRIAKIRDDAGLTQQQFAVRLSDSMARPQIMSLSTISALETGRKLPSLPIVIGISRLFGVSCDYILGLTDEPDEHLTVPLASINSNAPQDRPIITDVILPSDYRYYHLQPVYIIFPRKTYADQWGILNESKKTLTLADRTISYVDIPVQLYPFESYDTPVYRKRKARPVSAADFENMKNKQFWVELKNPDNEMCLLFNGWYVFSKTGKAIVNVAEPKISGIFDFCLECPQLKALIDNYHDEENGNNKTDGN